MPCARVAGGQIVKRQAAFAQPRGGAGQNEPGKAFPNKDVAAQLMGQMTEAIPMKRFGKAEEVAKAVLFLAFDATFTTGLELPVDGGWSQL